MENEKYNSAVDKVETASAESKKTAAAGGKKSGGKTSAAGKSGVKQTKTDVFAGENVSAAPAQTAMGSGVKKEQARVEREERVAARRREAEKIRDERKEKKARAENARKQAIIRRRETLAAEKLRRREERAARRDAMKNESREARAERLAAERQERFRLKKEKAEIRARLLSEKRENKKLLKQQKRQQRARNKTEKRSRGIGGWLAAVIALGCSTLLLGALLTFNVFYMSGGNEMLDSSYKKAFYDLTGYVDNIDVNLGKLAVASSPARQQKILTDLVVQSELAENQLQALPLEDSSRYYTGKFINQLGDYAKSLSDKLADGGSLTDADRENLNEFYRRNTNLQNSLAKISKEVDGGYSFLSLMKPTENDAVLTNLNELENLSLEYPKMIYDGPFSDGLDRKEAKGLKGSEVTKEEAVKKFRALFSDYAVTSAEVINEANGDFETYNVAAETEKGWPVYAQMSKRGGTIVTFNCYEPCEEEKFTLEECREIAEVFVKKAGFEGMRPVWETASRAVAQFNFAFVKNGVIVYSDLVKVNVCMERGVVSAIDASSYCLNHTEREIPDAEISEKTAIKGVSALLDVRNTRKVIVPVGNSGERLAYEVFGYEGGNQYFVYIDALTGKEIEIFKVVESTEGTLVI